MSKRHQSSRRRSYGRRQHELRERPLEQRDQQPVDADEGGELSRAGDRRLRPDAAPHGCGFLDTRRRSAVGRLGPRVGRSSGRLPGRPARSRPAVQPRRESIGPPPSRVGGHAPRVRGGPPGEPGRDHARRRSHWPSCSASSRWSRASACRPPATRSTGSTTSSSILDGQRQQLIADLNRLGAGVGDPQAGDRPGARPAGRAPHRPCPLAEDRLDARTDRLAPPPPRRPARRSSSSARASCSPAGLVAGGRARLLAGRGPAPDH